jgi:hypothetical protein
MDPAVRRIVNQLKYDMPPILAGQALDRLTGDALRWRQVEEWILNGSVPSNCFFQDDYSGRIVADRDQLLEWWGERLSASVGPWRKAIGELIERNAECPEIAAGAKPPLHNYAAAVATDPDALLTRAKTAEELTRAGFPTAVSTLKTLASRGGGPPYRKAGSRVAYRWGDAFDWAQSKLGPAQHSTSAADVAAIRARRGGTPKAAPDGAAPPPCRRARMISTV